MNSDPNTVPFTPYAETTPDKPPAGFRTNFDYHDLPEHFQRWLDTEWKEHSPAVQDQIRTECRKNASKTPRTKA